MYKKRINGFTTKFGRLVASILKEASMSRNVYSEICL